MLKMDVEALTAFVATSFPQVAGAFVIEALANKAITIRMPVTQQNLRPGGTVSGPAMFMLADVAVYLALLATIGPEALAVTTNASLDFLRKPPADRDLIADCRLLKVGRVLAVGDVLIRSDGSEELLARATLTYSIPPGRTLNFAPPG